MLLYSKKFKFIAQSHYTTAPTRFATGFDLGSQKYRAGTGVAPAALVLDRYSILLLATRVIPKGCRGLPCPITSTCLYSGLDKICLSAGCVKPWDSLVTGGSKIVTGLNTAREDGSAAAARPAGAAAKNQPSGADSRFCLFVVKIQKTKEMR